MTTAAAPDEVEPATKRRRRWPWVIGGVIAALAVLAALGWWVWLPSWRPSLHPGERYGIDVSNHQGSIDWDRVASDGIDFAYLKATEGSDHVDGRFAANWQRSGAARLDRGAYHFFTLCSPGTDQARNFLATAPPDDQALAPAVDLELVGNCHQRPDSAAMDQELNQFLDAVESAWGRSVVLYVGQDFEDQYHVRDRYQRPTWHQRLLRRPDGGWTIWQAQGYAHVDGVSGPVDLDVMRSP